MRISTSQLYANAINSITERQSSLSNLQLQLSEGKRLLTPADDPAGAARVVNLTESISSTEQYDKNLDIAENRLQAEEAALTGLTNLIQRVRELTVQGNSDSYDPRSRELIATEIRQRFEELVTTANTRDSANEYIFAGFQTLAEAFTVNPDGTVSYNGDEGQRFLQVSPSRQVATNDSGADVFGLVGGGNGRFITRGSGLNTGTGTIGPGSITNPNAFVPDDYTVIFGEQTAVTGGTLVFNDDATTADTLQYQLTINGTIIDTLNEGDARTLAQIESAINAQSGLTNVRAYIDAGQLYLANTTPTAGPITIDETLLGASDGALDTATGFFGSALDGATPSNTITYDVADSYLVFDSSNNIVTAGAYTAGSNIDFNGQRLNISGAPNNGDQFTSVTNNEQDLFATLSTLADALENSVLAIPAVPTTASLAGYTPPVAAAGGENFQVTIDGIDLINVALPGAGTVTAAQLDTALATFLGANAGYTIASGSFATNDLVLQKDDGTPLDIQVVQNTTATPAALTGLEGIASNGVVADPTNTSVFHDTMANILDNLDRNLSGVIDIRARVGARLNSIEDQRNVNATTLIQVQSTLSQIQDLDYASAISELEQQSVILQASQQSFLRIQGLSLFNFL